MHAIPLQCVRRIVSQKIVTPVWLSTSLDNCSELACHFLQPFSSEDELIVSTLFYNYSISKTTKIIFTFLFTSLLFFYYFIHP